MFGLYFEATCPNCGQKHPVSLGACTGYYKVNNYELEYTDYICPLCGKKYWLSHGFSAAIDTKKMNESDTKTWLYGACW